MKASESNKHYASKVRECSNFAVREIKKVCKDIGPRPGQSEAETKTQDSIEALMTTIADETVRREFSVKGASVKPFMTVGAVAAAVAVVLAALTLFGVLPQISGVALIAVLGVAVLAAELFVFAGGRLFKISVSPVGKSSDVVCVRRAAGETKRRIILGGHVDSSYEFRFADKMSSITAMSIVAPILILVSSVITYFADSISSLVPETAANSVGIVVNSVVIVINCAALAMLIPQLFIVNTKVCCQGASNGLTGVYTSMAVLKYLNDNDVRFENTEVVAVSLGGGFSGSAGAKNFDLVSDGAETVFLGVDTLSDFNNIRVSLDSDAAGLVQAAAELADCKAPNISGKYDVPDAAAVSARGVKSAYLTACAPDKMLQYRTSEDIASKLDMKAVETGLRIMLESVFLFDERGF